MAETCSCNNLENQLISKKKNSTAEAANKGISLLGSFDGEAILQAVVLAELLGKPKAKRGKRGYSRHENTDCRR